MVKAGAMYYAIFLSFIISLLSGLLILGVWYHHFHTTSLIQEMRMHRNIHSALLIAMESPDFISIGSTKSINLFDDSINNVNVTESLWGGYLLLRAKANWRHINYSRISLCGNDISMDDSIALYLSDNERYLSLSGSTLLKGNCYLPKLGIRRAYIEGLSYNREKLIYGLQKQSNSTLPPLSETVMKYISNYLHNNILPGDSIANIDQLIRSDSISNSFFQKSLVFYSDHWITLSRKSISGNIKIISKKGITILNSVNTSDILLFAPKIEVEANFHANVQIFATDTIQIGERATFFFPSIIGLLENTCKKPLIKIGKNSTILGDVTLQSTSSERQGISIIDENTEIYGKVYCNGKVELKGKIYGSLFCEGFRLLTPTSLYENNLLNATIDFTKLPKYYSGSLIYSNSLHYKQIKWEK